MRSIVSRNLGCLVALMLTESSALAAVPGKAVYEGTCIACHGAGGEGALPGSPISRTRTVCCANPTVS